jgi:hypothetical protein
MSTLLDAWRNIFYNISTKFYHFHYFSSILLNTNVFSGQFLHIVTINVPAHLLGSYMRECALIYLKICMVATVYADYFSLKFQKDPLSSCGEINVLLSLEQFCDKPEKTKGSVQKIRLALNWPPPMPMTVFIF